MEWFQKKYMSFILSIIVVLIMIFFVKEYIMSKQEAFLPKEELLVVYTPHPTTFIQPIIEEFEKTTTKKIKRI